MINPIYETVINQVKEATDDTLISMQWMIAQELMNRLLLKEDANNVDNS